MTSMWRILSVEQEIRTQKASKYITHFLANTESEVQEKQLNLKLGALTN